jgi:hypothetical protein
MQSYTCTDASALDRPRNPLAVFDLARSISPSRRLVTDLCRRRWSPNARQGQEFASGSETGRQLSIIPPSPRPVRSTIAGRLRREKMSEIPKDRKFHPEAIIIIIGMSIGMVDFVEYSQTSASVRGCADLMCFRLSEGMLARSIL